MENIYCYFFSPNPCLFGRQALKGASAPSRIKSGMRLKSPLELVPIYREDLGV